MKKLLPYGIAAVIACMTTGTAVAGGYDDEYGGEAKAWHDKDMHEKDMGHKMGKHGMSGTIESIDQKTGWLKVKTEEGSLNVHFPPDSLKDLKNGDTITVYLSFSKGGETMKGSKMKGGEKMDDKMMK